MRIECPSCSADNKVNFGDNVLCSSCNKSFAGHAYKKIKKPLISATTAFLIGAYGGHKIDDAIESERYPVDVEIEIFDACLNADERPLTSSDYQNKKNTCICALKETMNEIPLTQYDNDEESFLDAFLNNSYACK